MKNLVLDLTDPSASDAAVSGSKGATLARITAAGVAVPRGFVVTTEVFADVTAGKLSGFNESISRIEASDLESLQSVSEMAQDAIRKLELPDGVFTAVKAAHERLGSAGVAVRSSATAEDLPGASFAGQYDSFLNVLSLPQIADSLLKAWASLYSVRAISYALSNGISFEKVRMAVVIQQQLHPHVSGVMFTQDPLTGANRLVVNAALGLGEGVVDGTMPADQFTVEPGNGKIIRSEVAAKETMMVVAPGGGTQRSPVPESQRSKPALSETQLEELAALGSRLEGLLDGPQDIEFAFEDGGVQCLQARPITGVEQPEASTVDWESQVDGRYTWQPSRMRIHSGPMYRLQQDAVEAYVEGQKVCFEQTGSSMARNCVMQAVLGYSYVRPLDVDDETLAEIQERHNALCDGYTEQGTTKYHQEVRPEVESVLAELNRLRRKKASLPARVEYLAAAMEAFGHVMGHLHWCQGRMDRRIDWPSVFHEITDEPAEISGVFLQVVPTMTTRMISRLREIARIVRDDGELSAIFAGRRYDELSSPELRRSPKFNAFQSGYRRLMRVHGLRTGWSYGSSSDFETPTWNMAPEKPLDIIASYAEQDLDDLDRLEADALRERQHHTRRIRRKLASDPPECRPPSHHPRWRAWHYPPKRDHLNSAWQTASGSRFA